MAMGLPAAIGISFSILGKAQTRMVEAFDKGDLATAQHEQVRSLFFQLFAAFIFING